MAQQRIGVLTSGGDCPGFNAVLRGLVCAATRSGLEVLGIHNGFEGLLALDQYQMLNLTNMDRMMQVGGTMLGSTSRGHFCTPRGRNTKSILDEAIVDQAAGTCRQLGLEALIVIGGDGSMTTALHLYQSGFPIIGVPKTIDNDLEATAMTFGFDSAVACATEAIDRLQTTAASHQRVMILEVMGRHAGWIALWSGVAGGAAMILIPEIPFQLEKIMEKIRERERQGYTSTMIVVAEGARWQESSFHGKISRGGSSRGEGVGQILARDIEKKTGKETRCCVLGHLQRGGTPTTLDRILGTRFGIHAVQLAIEKKFGTMVSYDHDSINEVSIAHAVHRLKRVSLDHEMVSVARVMGISFGNS